MASGFTSIPAEQIERLRAATQSRVGLAKELYVRRSFSRDFGVPEPDVAPHTHALLFAAESLETVGVDLLTRYPHRDEISKPAWADLVWAAYRIRRSLSNGLPIDLRRTVDEVVDGVLANRQPETRLRLCDIPIDEPVVLLGQVSWPEYVISEASRAFLLLVRKRWGSRDIAAARQAIADLRQKQSEWEPGFLADLPGIKSHNSRESLAARAALARLVASYNAAQAVDITAQFLADGGASQGRSPQGTKDDLDRFVYIYSTVVNKMPWGLRAIQKVAFRDAEKQAWENLSLLPAMMYHGVRSREALALRMLGVPRVAAEGLAKQVREHARDAAGNIPAWIQRSTDADWQRALPPAVSLTGSECRLLWEVLDGRRTWDEAFGQEE